MAVLDGCRASGRRRPIIPFDELAHHLDRLRWAVRVVVADEVDLAPVDALVVDLLEAGGDGLADRPVGRGIAAVRGGVADLISVAVTPTTVRRRLAGHEAGHAEANDEGWNRLDTFMVFSPSS
jgi:hypothetical protein